MVELAKRVNFLLQPSQRVFGVPFLSEGVYIHYSASELFMISSFNGQVNFSMSSIAYGPISDTVAIGE